MVGSISSSSSSGGDSGDVDGGAPYRVALDAIGRG